MVNDHSVRNDLPLRAALLVVLVGTLLILPRFGHRHVVGSHEAVFPIVARDILARHAWFHAELRGMPYRNKPPLYPWAIAVVSWPAGRVTELTSRLPGALAAIGAAAVTSLLGASLFGARAGLWSGVMLLTSTLFFDHALTVIPDMPMVLFDLLAGLALWAVSNGAGRGALLGFYVALALAVFTKGIPGLLPLAVGLVWLTIDEGRGGIRRLLWSPGVVLFAAITAVWALPYVISERFGSEVLWRDWLRGPLGSLALHTLAQQLAYLWLGFLPWALVLPIAIVAAVRARRVRPVAFALCWFVVQGLCVLAVQQQRLRYLLPLLPGAALLVAWWADREATAVRARPILAATTFGVSCTAVLLVPSALHHYGILAAIPQWEIGLMMVGVLAVGAVAAASLWTAQLGRGLPMIAATSALVLFAGGWILDDWEKHAFDYPGVATGLRTIEPPLAVVALADDHELLQVDFYLGRALRPLRSADDVRRHLATIGGAVLVEGPRWRSADQWLQIDRHDLRTDALGADVFLVTNAPR